MKELYYTEPIYREGIRNIPEHLKGQLYNRCEKLEQDLSELLDMPVEAIKDCLFNGSNILSLSQELNYKPTKDALYRVLLRIMSKMNCYRWIAASCEELSMRRTSNIVYDTNKLEELNILLLKISARSIDITAATTMCDDQLEGDEVSYLAIVNYYLARNGFMQEPDSLDDYCDMCLSLLSNENSIDEDIWRLMHLLSYKHPEYKKDAIRIPVMALTLIRSKKFTDIESTLWEQMHELDKEGLKALIKSSKGSPSNSTKPKSERALELLQEIYNIIKEEEI